MLLEGLWVVGFSIMICVEVFVAGGGCGYETLFHPEFHSLVGGWIVVHGDLLSAQVNGGFP